MIPKSWRIKLFNWLGAGKVTLTTHESPEEYKSMSYSLGNNGNGLTIAPNGYGSTSLGLQTTSQTMSIKITPANGGTIIQVNVLEYGVGELYIIPEGADFDRELGKIITMSKLKA
jgi:hypothetical protein